MAETGYYISDDRLWDFVPRLLHTESTLDISTGNLIEITICQNPTFDPGNQDYQYTVELSGGQETHDIPSAEFSEEENMHVWLRIDFTIEDTNSEASVASAEIESEGGFIYGFVRDSTGQGIQGALIKAINSDDIDSAVGAVEAEMDNTDWTMEDQGTIDGDIEGYVTKSDDEGKYMIEPEFDNEDQKMFHLAARYSDTTGDFNAVSKPFIGVEPALPVYTEEVHYPVGEPLFWWPFSGGDAAGYSFATLEGAQMVRGNWFDGYAVSGNGTDQYVNTHNWGSFGSNMTSDFSISFTVETTSTETQTAYLGTINDDSTFLLIQHNNDGAAGNVEFCIRDDNSDNITSYTDGGLVNDGNPHRVVCRKVGNSASDLEIWIDGEQAPTSISLDNNMSSPQDFSGPVNFLSRHYGTPEWHMDAIIDDVVVYGNSLSASQIHNDYARQPWNEAERMPYSGVLRWEFEAGSGTTVSDSWGSYSGTTNATWTTTANQGSYALNHDGTNDVTTSDGNLPSSVTGSNPRSLGAWVYVNNLPSGENGHIINYGGASTENAFGFYLPDGSNSLNFFSWGSDYDTGFTVSTGSWHHVVCTFDGSVVNTYADGSPTPTTGQSISLSTTASPLYVGARMDDVAYTDAIIDDPRIYSKRLTDTEVSNWYNTGSI